VATRGEGEAFRKRGRGGGQKSNHGRTEEILWGAKGSKRRIGKKSLILKTATRVTRKLPKKKYPLGRDAGEGEKYEGGTNTLRGGKKGPNGVVARRGKLAIPTLGSGKGQNTSCGGGKSVRAGRDRKNFQNHRGGGGALKGSGGGGGMAPNVGGRAQETRKNHRFPNAG